MGGGAKEQLASLFRRAPVLDMQALLQAFPGRSQRSIIRDLVSVGYLASYNHAGRFYTLTDVPQFDTDGLWQYQGVFFSRHGTLKATVRHLVQTAGAGQTHPELQQRLHVRVHNTLLDLVRRNEIAREEVDKLFLYVSVDSEVRINQIAKRRQQMEHRPPAPAVGPYEVIEVLLDVIRFGEQRPEQVASHLRDKGLGVSIEQVAAVFDCYDLGKKNSLSRS
ncbi:MAG: hypothetical protein QMD10_12280 [Desulfitobacteriaceae bacterium]|nr:hypothetical protein [Desulfitobacteriaceae bacterium]